MMEYKIFANHAHIFPAECRENCGIPALKELMKTCGIEKCVCFAPFQDRFSESTLTGSSVDWLYEQIKDNASLVGFGTVDFERDDLEKQVEHIYSLGFKGIKIHPAYQEINIMGDKAQRVYKKAEELDLFLSFHTGLHWYRISEYNVLLFDEVAWHYPHLRFTMEHIGGYAFFRDALTVMANNSRGDINHVFAGWTSISMDDNGLRGNWSLSDDELRTLVNITGPEMSMFGLDFPYNREDSIIKAIDRIKNLDIPEDAKKGILGENLARELGFAE